MKIVDKKLKFKNQLIKRKKTSEIIIHCSASKEGQDWSVESIHNLHLKNGWSGIGYNFVIGLDGTIYIGRGEEYCGAHTTGHNSNSIGICYVGGVDKNGKPKDTRTEAQSSAMIELITYLLEKYPTAKLSGHNQWAAKACPSFNVPVWAQDNNLPFDLTIKR